MFKSNQQSILSVTTRALAPNVALVSLVAEQDAYVTPSGYEQPKTLDRVTFVVVRGADGWRIVHGQNTIVDARAAAGDPALRMPGRKP